MSWSGGKDGASNDPEDYHPNLTLRNGYPVVYDCSDRLEPNEQTNVISLDFEYEVTMLADADYTETSRYLEWSILWNTAQAIGLYKCNLDSQEFGDNRVAVIGSDDEDYLHARYATCSVEVPGVPDGTYDTECYPTQGTMSATYTGSDSEAVRNYLLSQIKEVLQSPSVLVGDVKYVTLLSERSRDLTPAPTPSPDPTQPRSTASTNNGRSNILYIGIGVGASVALLALIALIVVKRLRKSKREEKHQLPVVAPTDMSDTTPERMEEVVLISPLSDVPKADIAIVTNPVDAPPVTPIQEPSTPRSKPSESPVDVDAFVEETDPKQEKPLKSAAEASQKAVPIATQRRRRKKKKKRRKRKLKPIDKMESITEENEEEVQAESDCDSEWSDYSTDDDESSCITESSYMTESSGATESNSPPICVVLKESPKENRLTEANLKAFSSFEVDSSRIKPLPAPWV